MIVFHLSANVYDELPASHHTKRIWEELAKDCDEYHVIGSAGKLNYSHTIEGKIHLHLLPSIGRRGWPFFFTSWLSLLLAIKHRPNRIIAQCPVNGGMASILFGYIFSAPVLIEVHGSHYFSPDKKGIAGKLTHSIYSLLARFSFNHCTRIRSLSGDMTQNILGKFGGKHKDKIVEIGNRVDLEVFNKTKDSYTLGENIRIVSVGSYVHRKGFIPLIRELLPRVKKAKLILVGKGVQHDEYQKVAAELGVEDRLELSFAATHRDVADYLYKSDIYVHPSLAEAVPRAILEAMAMGLPVVATKVGFLDGVVENGKDILLVPPNNPLAMVEEIERLIESEALRRRIGSAAASTIRDRFEWNSVFNQYRKLIYTMPLPDKEKKA